MTELPQAESADTDAVQMALQAARTLWSRGEATESLRWLKRAAESASDEGADVRSLQLAKAAAELRAMLSAPSSEGPLSSRGAPPRDTGMRPAHPEAFAREGEGRAGGPLSGEAGAGALSDDPASSSLSGAPQYVVHRPRETQRQLTGRSSSTLEAAGHRNGSAYPSLPSWSAGSERRSSPPPLPGASLDDYEELEAEPEEETGEQAAVSGWSGPHGASAWGPSEVSQARSGPREAHLEVSQMARRDGVSGPSSRKATLPPPTFTPSLSSTPPPLPELSAFGEDDGDPMRPEQPTVLIPSEDDPPAESALAGRVANAAASVGSAHDDGLHGDHGWHSDARMSWDSAAAFAWSGESRPAGWAAPPSAPVPAHAELPAPAESVPAKLTARVHHQAVRVALAPDSRTAGQYVVRALREGERPALGERVALLVALEPGVPLV